MPLPRARFVKKGRKRSKRIQRRSLTQLLPRAGCEKDKSKTDKRLRWDAAAERFTNSDEANRFLSRPYRAGYTLPADV